MQNRTFNMYVTDRFSIHNCTNLEIEKCTIFFAYEDESLIFFVISKKTNNFAPVKRYLFAFRCTLMQKSTFTHTQTNCISIYNHKKKENKYLRISLTVLKKHGTV